MLIAVLLETIGEYLRYRSQLARIELLDDRLLRDIGLERGELRAAAWQAVHGATH
jgi:uncharacterized protein YjiS (DUF1127 family)